MTRHGLEPAHAEIRAPVARERFARQSIGSCRDVPVEHSVGQRSELPAYLSQQRRKLRGLDAVACVDVTGASVLVDSHVKSAGPSARLELGV